MEGRQREAVIIWQGTCGSPPLGGRSHRGIHSSLCCHFSSFSHYLLLWVMCGSVAGCLEGG